MNNSNPAAYFLFRMPSGILKLTLDFYSQFITTEPTSQPSDFLKKIHLAIVQFHIKAPVPFECVLFLFLGDRACKWSFDSKDHYYLMPRTWCDVFMICTQCGLLKFKTTFALKVNLLTSYIRFFQIYTTLDFFIRIETFFNIMLDEEPSTSKGRSLHTDDIMQFYLPPKMRAVFRGSKQIKITTTWLIIRPSISKNVNFIPMLK